MRNIRAKDLKGMLDSNTNFYLINVLDADAFEREHIPSSANIPNQLDDFVSRVEELVGSKSDAIVVYCASKDCEASPNAARKLEKAGFENVMDFAGGMAEWKLAGHEVETGKEKARATA